MLKWDRVIRVEETVTIERAKLDVAFNTCHGQRVYFNVVVPAAGSTNPDTVCSRAARDGAAVARVADGKRVRYPGSDLAHLPWRHWASLGGTLLPSCGVWFPRIRRPPLWCSVLCGRLYL